MEVSDVKKGLKDAKEFVKNKDFNAALEICKVCYCTIFILQT